MSSATVNMAGFKIRGTYQGGPYIDLHFGAEEIAFNNINVWDYQAGRAMIANDDEAVRQAMQEWADEAGESLQHDLQAMRENTPIR